MNALNSVSVKLPSIPGPIDKPITSSSPTEPARPYGENQLFGDSFNKVAPGGCVRIPGETLPLPIDAKAETNVYGEMPEFSKADIKKLTAAAEFFEKNPLGQGEPTAEQKQHLSVIRDVLEKKGVKADSIPQNFEMPTPEQFNSELQSLIKSLSANGEKVVPFVIGFLVALAFHPTEAR